MVYNTHRNKMHSDKKKKGEHCTVIDLSITREITYRTRYVVPLAQNFCAPL